MLLIFVLKDRQVNLNKFGQVYNCEYDPNNIPNIQQIFTNVSPGASTGGLCQPNISVHRGGTKGWSADKDPPPFWPFFYVPFQTEIYDMNDDNTDS